MGFVVEEHLNESESISSVVKKDQAVVYGKAEYMWQVSYYYSGHCFIKPPILEATCFITSLRNRQKLSFSIKINLSN